MLAGGAYRGSPASSPAGPAASADALPGVEAGGEVDDAFELLEMLGKGSYGSVYKGRARSTGELFAIKVIPMAEGVRVRALPASPAGARLRDGRLPTAGASAEQRARCGERSCSACALCSPRGRGHSALATTQSNPCGRRALH